jgi:hypothetical protein
MNSDAWDWSGRGRLGERKEDLESSRPDGLRERSGD